MTELSRRELLLYTARDGAVKVGVLFRDETAWLTQKALAELLAVGVPGITKHLKNMFESGELSDSEASVVSILEATAVYDVFEQKPAMALRDISGALGGAAAFRPIPHQGAGGTA